MLELGNSRLRSKVIALPGPGLAHTLMLSCSSSVWSAPFIRPYHGLSRDMAAYMLNLNIEIGAKVSVMEISLYQEERERRGEEKERWGKMERRE